MAWGDDAPTMPLDEWRKAQSPQSMPLGSRPGEGGGPMTHPRVTVYPEPQEKAPLDTISQYESGNRNVPNYRYDEGHTAAGYLQITDTNWKKYAPGLGIDLNQYPNAMSAPKDIQYQVGAKMYKESGYAPWAPYNQKLAAAVGWGDKTPVVSSGRWRVSDSAIRNEQSRSDTSVYWVNPMEALAMLPPMDDQNEPSGQRQRQELDQSLANGDEITDIPRFDIQTKGGKAKIIDYDGRHRLEEAIRNHVDLVPVAFKGLPSGIKVTGIEGFRGGERPFDFTAVPPVPRETLGAKMAQMKERDTVERASSAQQSLAHQQAAANGYVSESLEALREGVAAIPGALADVGKAALGVGERALLPKWAQPQNLSPVGPGMEALGGLAVFATGGLTNPLRTSAPAVMPAIRASNAMRQLSPEGQAMIDAANQARGMQFPRPVPLERITPEDAALAKEAVENFGIPLYGLQNAATQVAKERAIVQQASRTIGENSPALTDKVMEAAKTRIGNGLTQIETSHNVRFDPQFRADMIQISNDAKSELTTAGQIRVVDKHLKDVMVDPVKTEAAKKVAAAAPKTPGKPAPKPKEVLRNGLSGEQFGNLMHQDGPIEKLTNNSDPGVARFGERIEIALRDLFQRQLPADKAAEYQGLRYQWKNLKTLEKAVGPTGELDHGKLNTAVNKAFPNRAYDKRPTLVKLSDIANKFGKPPTQSRTGPVGHAAELLGGFAVGHILGGPLGGILGAAVTRGGDLAVRNALRRLTEPTLTDKLINRALQSLPPPGARRNAIHAMMAERGARTLLAPPPRPPSPATTTGMRTMGAPGGTGWPGGRPPWASP